MPLDQIIPDIVGILIYGNVRYHAGQLGKQGYRTTINTIASTHLTEREEHQQPYSDTRRSSCDNVHRC